MRWSFGLVYHMIVWAAFVGLYLEARWHNFPVTLAKSNDELKQLFSSEGKIEPSSALNAVSFTYPKAVVK